MRKTLTAGTALIAAAAHPRRATYAVTSTTSAGPTPHFPAFYPTTGTCSCPTCRRTPSPTSRSALARPAPSPQERPPHRRDR